MKTTASHTSERKKKSLSANKRRTHKLNQNIDTRTCLLKAAQRVFAQKGFDGASVKNVADEAGVNISLISYHFNGKAGIYRSCLEEFGKTRLAVMQNLLKTPTSIEDFRVRLQLFIEDLIHCHIQNQDVTRMMERELVSEMDKDLFKSLFRQIFQTLVDFMQEGQKAGFLRKELDPRLSTSLFFGGLIHLVHMNRFHKEINAPSLSDENFRKSIIQHALQNFMKGVLQEPT